MDREQALLSLFATVDAVFEDGIAFARKHECPASVALGRVFNEWKRTRSVMEAQAESYGVGGG